MFCALIDHHSNTDHVVLQVSCYGLCKLDIKRNGAAIKVPEYKYSFIVSGGFEPGVYNITSHNQYVQFFIMQHGKELHSGIIDGSVDIEISRYNYKIL